MTVNHNGIKKKTVAAHSPEADEQRRKYYKMSWSEKKHIMNVKSVFFIKRN